MGSAGETRTAIGRLKAYARTVVPETGRADAIVAATLQEIESELDDGVLSSSPERLFRVFSAILNRDAGRALVDEAAERALARQAILLMSLESFDERQVAGILGIPEGAVRGLLARSAVDEGPTSPTILVIEDEPILALELEDCLKANGYTRIVVARTRREAVASAASARPDIVLADIVLADGESGIEAVNEILTERAIPVVFVTAHPEEFFSAESPGRVVVITKPYQRATVAAAVRRALALRVDPAAFDP